MNLILKNTVLISTLTVLMISLFSISNAYADHEDAFFKEMIRNPTSTNAGNVLNDAMPSELEALTAVTVEKVDSHADSESLAEDTLFGIFDVVENQFFGETISMITEKFGERILEMISNITMNAFEASFSLFE